MSWGRRSPSSFVQKQWTDEEMLEALHMRDVLGMDTTQIGKALGRPRRSVIGLLDRVNKQTTAHDPDGNQNGTMPARWWERKGEAA